jgi:putative ABC transport system permease protein
VNVRDWKSAQTTLEAIALVRAGALTLTGPDGAQQLSALFADPEYFRVFDARTSLGRLFGPDENRVPDGHPVAVLTHDSWARVFGSDPDVVGSDVDLSGTPYTIIGVLSSDYRDPFPGANGAGNDLILPAMMVGQIDPRGREVLEVRRWRTFGGVGLLRAGVSAGEANEELRQIAARLESVDAVNRGMSADVQLFNQASTQAIRGPALTLLGGAVVLLLIACFNVATLLSVRGSLRERELAVQLALGAGRSRVFRLLTVESLMLALAGGALGVATAALTLPALLGLMPNQLPPTADVQVNLPVLLAALAATLGAGAAFGILPAARQSVKDLRDSLSAAGRSIGSRSSDRVRNGLVFFEMATATILLASSALLIRSFQSLNSADSGFETENVLTFRLSLPAARYDDEASMAIATEQLTARIAELPGVKWAQPWGPGRPGQVFNFLTSIPYGMAVDQISDAPLSRRHGVGPGALEDLGLALLRGRTITEEDRAGTERIAVISESMAEGLWPGEDPIGKRWHNFQPPGAPIPGNRSWTVVGVVSDAQHGGRVTLPGAIVTQYDSYFPLVQWPERGFTMLVRTIDEPDIAPVREAVRAFDPNIPIFQVATMEENFRQEEGTSRLAAQLMGGFGLAALLLAALGVYGVVSFSVSQRTREIGLRAALGADPGTTLRHFVARGLRLAGAGIVLGSLTAFTATQGLRALLPNVPEMDAVAVAIASASLVSVALIACLLPAARATRIAPVLALREE